MTVDVVSKGLSAKSAGHKWEAAERTDYHVWMYSNRLDQVGADYSTEEQTKY